MRLALSLLDDAMKGHGVISYQVVQECLNLMLRKFRQRISLPHAHAYLEEVLLPLCKVRPSDRLFLDALSIAGETGWAYYDSLIVASAIAGECDILYTEDLQHGRTIRGVRIQNPFA